MLIIINHHEFHRLKLYIVKKKKTYVNFLFVHFLIKFFLLNVFYIFLNKFFLIDKVGILKKKEYLFHI